MFNLLNVAIGIFGTAKDWNGGAVIALMALVQVAILGVAAYLVVSILKRRKANQATAAAQSAVVAEQPTVTEPTPIVVQSVAQSVVVERVVEQPIVVVQREVVEQETLTMEEIQLVALEETTSDENVEAGALRYDKSFTARLIQSDDEIKGWYNDIKNELLCYKGVKGRISWKRETFKCGGKLVLAKLAFRGKRLCLFLPLSVAEHVNDYTIEDASENCYKDTPMMIRLKNPKRVQDAKELIAKIMAGHGLQRIAREPVDYYLPYEGLLALINKGLVKREIRTAEEEAIFTANQDD